MVACMCFLVGHYTVVNVGNMLNDLDYLSSNLTMLQ